AVLRPAGGPLEGVMPRAGAARTVRRARPLRRTVGCPGAAATRTVRGSGAATRTVRRARTAATRTVRHARTAAARTVGTRARACAGTAARTIAATRIEHLVAATAAEVHALVGAGADVVVAESLLTVDVVVAHAPAGRRVVRPVVAAQRIHAWPIGNDVAVAPIHAAAPDVVARPAPDQVAGAEPDAGPNDAGADVAGITPVIGRIVGIRPAAIDDIRIV